MADHNEETPNKYNVGDTTAKGVVACVLMSRHPKASRYMMVGGKKYTEWQIDGVPEPAANTRIKKHE